MCTVSYITHNQGFNLTSNRDELVSRPTKPPKIYEEFNQQLVYPKDELAGGTWIAISNQNITVCLLNGAFKKHKRKPPYARSRGQVLKQRFDYQTNRDFVDNLNLKNIEPFTLLLIDHKDKIDFAELVWDGTQKHYKSIDPSKNHIWASATLYSEDQRQSRKKWFQHFLNQHHNITPNDILNFHTGSYTDDKKNDMLMQRNKMLKTISVSQINVFLDKASFVYKDLEQNKTHHQNLDLLCKTV
ncbi:NRDE family protein [Flavobacterium sp. CS20]|jgi:hypothetical protein|uniref:NRDE family protein n=1 Tax=Flavobacterium sp. CS20 TaxID=2775246 RepID=UPI001B3A2A6D|nr:NRDE family protein [Flavobacterium sp. CS20]QTY27966.1 NRDE family protein [Flavobacterium sp. CS20]